MDRVAYRWCDCMRFLRFLLAFLWNFEVNLTLIGVGYRAVLCCEVVTLVSIEPWVGCFGFAALG